MRLTGKGQVTIPQAVREQLGLRPGDEVDFVMDGDGARLIRQPTSPPARGRRLVDRLRNRGDVAMSTDEIMALTRGDRQSERSRSGKARIASATPSGPN